MARIPPRTISAIKHAVQQESANVRAIYSGLIEVPPLKLKPFSAGISIDNGDPATKNVKSGKKNQDGK